MDKVRSVANFRVFNERTQETLIISDCIIQCIRYIDSKRNTKDWWHLSFEDMNKKKAYATLYNYLRDLRAENNELLSEMARKLSISAMELSAIEHRKMAIPQGFLEKIKQLYLVNKDYSVQKECS